VVSGQALVVTSLLGISQVSVSGGAVPGANGHDFRFILQRQTGGQFVAGYSGTPLPKKLGIKPQLRVALVDLPSEVGAELKEALAGCRKVNDRNEALDFAMVCVKTQPELKKHFAHLKKRLAPAGMLWISWPKKSSGVASDLNENVVRQIGLKEGLVDVKVCAVSEVWSGLKFVIRLKDR
jgi:hypothetical protein